MILGLPIVGPISRSHRWDPFDHNQQVLSVEQLNSRAWEFSAKVIRNTNKCEISDNTQKVWDATMEDVHEGVTLGPYLSIHEVEQIVGTPWIPTQRFEVVQKNKVRGVDSATTNGINMATQITEKLDLPRSAIGFVRTPKAGSSEGGFSTNERHTDKCRFGLTTGGGA